MNDTADQGNRHRRAARARWDRITDPAARAAETAPATASRVNAATVAEEFEAFRQELAALRGQVADLQQRVAA